MSCTSVDWCRVGEDLGLVKEGLLRHVTDYRHILLCEITVIVVLSTAIQAEFRGLILSEISDPVRAENLVALSDQRAALIQRHSELVARYSSTMKKLNANYPATCEDFGKLVQVCNDEHRESQTEFVQLIGKMKAATQGVGAGDFPG